MAYKELIKNFNRIRSYMREFYVYGFKKREEYTRKSPRSYDNERRRIESILGNYIQFHQTENGKNVFLSIDSRITEHNPLYQAWKIKSFTDGDITFHFIIMDILESAKESLSIHEITKQVDQYLSVFESPKVFDESTIRKKLREYVNEGIIETEKCGKTLYYKKSDQIYKGNIDILDYFSEIVPCGVIGSFLLDQQLKKHKGKFAFKHHYITGTMDSDVMCQLFEAMQKKSSVTIQMLQKRTGNKTKMKVIPLQIFISVQSGRQYLMAYSQQFKRISSFRLDRIISVKIKKEDKDFEELRKKLKHMKKHIWGVSTTSRSGERMETVEFTVHYEENEPYIHQRLEREKRCGKVKKIDDHTSRFYAEVYDASELVPWIRTFLCRITEIHFSNKILETQFKRDIHKMFELYDLEGGEVQ